MRTIHVIDAPSDLGLRPTGVAGLPAALRQAGLLEGVPAVTAAGAVPVPPWSAERDDRTRVLNPAGIQRFSEQLAERVAMSLDTDAFPLVLGGDCSILLGVMLALKRRGRFGLLFVDGHADYYSPDVEPNGEVASMELASITGRAPRLLDHLAEPPLVREQDVVVFGFRDDASAAEHGSPDVRDSAIHVLDLRALREAGVAHAAAGAVTRLENGGAHGFWIHLDADVLNDAVMPAVDYRMPDGLQPAELSDALTAALASPAVVGMDITIYNPALDADGAAGRVLARAVTRAFRHTG